MGDEELEDTEFRPMWDAVVPSLNGKRIALFGSYGWGDGEWMRLWEKEAQNAGGNLVHDCVIANESPDAEAEAQCRELGKALAG